MADIWTEAGKIAGVSGTGVGLRYNWKPLPKPWYWIFSFWHERWKCWGEFEPLKPGDIGYEDAQYECAYLMHRQGQKLYGGIYGRG